MNEIKVVISATMDGFQDALKSVQRRLSDLDQRTQRIARRMQDFGNKMETVGRKLSVVSAGIGATAGAAFLLAKSTADNVRSIERLAQVSNASTTEFQRMAAGARTVGIEQDKLGDILKDMNDRIGDFNATGGGPMADFFENIAPKVGVTADAFKDLSGPQALQLYVSSLEKAGLNQQQMTFYMEAMASDATALLPLLASNGAEMNRLGDAAQKAGAVMDASAIAKSKEFNTALSELQTAFQGVKDRFAVTLMPVMTDLMNRITADVIPAIDAIVTKIGGWIESFNGLSPAVQDVVLAVTAAFGLGGPVVLAIGVAVKALAGMLLYLGPAGLIAGAVVAGIAAWHVWGDDVTAIVETINGKLDTLVTKALEAIGLGERASNIKTGAAQGQVMGGGGIGGMLLGTAGAIRGALSPPDGAAMGADVADGFVNGFQGQMINRIPDIDSAARIAEEVTRLATETNSPSRVFHRLGTYLGDGLANGITESTALVGAAAASMGQVAVDNVKTSTGAILNNMATMFQGSKKISAGIALANSWLAFTEVLKDPSFVGRPFARIAAAGAALASGLNAVRNIKSAQPGGTSGGGSGSAGGGASAAPSEGPLQVSLNTFGAGDFIRAADFGMILDRLNSEAGDRGYTILRPA
jgi:hypothetical protein